jgi:hypothetical protein
VLIIKHQNSFSQMARGPFFPYSPNMLYHYGSTTATSTVLFLSSRQRGF